MSDSHAILGAAGQLWDDMLSDEVARFCLPIGSVGFRVKGRHLLCDDAERDQCRVIGQIGKLSLRPGRSHRRERLTLRQQFGLMWSSTSGRASVHPDRLHLGLSGRWLDGAVRQQCAGHLPFERQATVNGSFSILPTGTFDPLLSFAILERQWQQTEVNQSGNGASRRHPRSPIFGGEIPWAVFPQS